VKNVQKETASRATINRLRGIVANPLTVEAILEHTLRFNPTNK
jgi:hypothetical protein